jgi:protein involved in polysaccharide export with SLBB domain
MRLIVVGAAIVMLLTIGSSTRTWAQEAARPGGQEISLVGGGEASFDPNQPIKPGFQISVNTSSAAGPEKELTGVFQVDPTGSIQMQLIGLVQLRGLTPSQAQDKIAALLKPYIKEPKVVVAILSVPKPVIFLTGGVTRVGPIPVNDGTTLAELLTTIGYNENADLSKVRLTRRDEKGEKVVKEYNFIRWLKPMPGEQPDETQNPTLNDKDFVYVPLKVLPGTGVVTVEGDVTKPGIYNLRPNIPTTLRQAISAAGGLNPTADRRQVTLRRVGMDRPFVVDYDRLEAGDPVHDIVLMPDDIVYVQKFSIDQYINLNGGFVKPARVAYLKDLTLTQAIAEVGGLVPDAKPKEGRIFRHIVSGDPTKTQVIAFNYEKIRSNKEPDIRLEPGDTVEIPLGRPPVQRDAFALAQQLLSIALLVDRLFSGNRRF